MTKWIVMLVGVGLLFQTGCRKNERSDAKSDNSEILIRCHFVGSGQLANNTNAVKLKEIWNIPETRRLAEQTMGKLSHAPKTLFSQAIDAAQDDRGATLIRPLLDDLLRDESFVQVRGTPEQPTEWTLLVRLSADRLAAWQAALAELVPLWKLGAIETNTVSGTSCFEIKRASGPKLVRWAETGDWLALGIGQEAVPTLDEALRRIKSSGRPVATAADYWLEADLNLPRLAKMLDVAPSFSWPAVQLSVIGQGENLRSKAKIHLAQVATGPLRPWQVPTNLINDPLISFTAMRGVEPFLRQWKVFNELGVEPAPDELFVWAQAPVPFQTFCAWQGVDLKATLQRLVERAPQILGTNFQHHGLAQIGWQATNQMVSWKLPFVAPFLQAKQDGGRDYFFGGLFPPLPNTNPPPPELLSQFTTRSNLVYYDWEITQSRLAQWHVMAQAMEIISSQPQLTTNSAAMRWLIKVGPHLGNTVTEIMADSPAQWSVTRKSHVGFTGFETIGLIHWLESTNFPKLSVELPDNRPVIPPGAAAGPRPK